jgi:hypothetical protein
MAKWRTIMKSKSWIATVSGLAIASLVLVAGPANAEFAYNRGQSKAVYDYARVVSAYPVVGYLTVTTPVEECLDDVQHYSVGNRASGLQSLTGKTIVLTGSLSPARFTTTDAIFNVGMAVAAVQASDPGVYIAMSGQTFKADSVRKNRAENRFESF